MTNLNIGISSELEQDEADLDEVVLGRQPERRHLVLVRVVRVHVERVLQQLLDSTEGKSNSLKTS